MTTELADQREAASIVSIFIVLLTVGVAIPLRAISLRLGVRHDIKSEDDTRRMPGRRIGLQPAPAE
jgi:hypothetical protein